MSRKRRRQISVKTPPPTTPDARREVAARASKALRSVEAAKLRQDIINVYNSEVHNVSYQVRKSRQLPTRKSLDSSVPQRRMPSQHELHNSRLRPQVRYQLQDAARRLECYARTSRREVLHALRKTGKAGRGNRRAKWTDKSYMRCK